MPLESGTHLAHETLLQDEFLRIFEYMPLIEQINGWRTAQKFDLFAQDTLALECLPGVIRSTSQRREGKSSTAGMPIRENPTI
jgi:hypothetical protein